MSRKLNSPNAARRVQGHARYSMREQADKYINARAHRGQSKASGATLRSDRTVNRYKGDLGRAAETIQQTYGVNKLKDITQEQAQAFLDKLCQEKLATRTIQGYAKALETLPLVNTLKAPSRRQDARDKPQGTRAYTPAQIHEIQRFILNPAALLATRLVLEAGCRAQDLASLCLESERPIRNARLNKLHPDRFAGREHWIKVSFIGKGGHEYVSTIAPTTASALAHYRLPAARDFRERRQENVVTKQVYDLPAGVKLSKLWGEAAQRSLGLSRGLHGLRHTFAQTRLAELQALGMPWQKALECVSQQMGHYRADEVKTYLR